jgi:integrase
MVPSGRDRRRSGDLTLFRRALYQLSYPTSPRWTGVADLTGFEPATSALTGRRALQTAPQVPNQLVCAGVYRTPNGIRTRVTALKGRRPWPLDDGGSNPDRA